MHLKKEITVDDFILCYTYFAIFYQIVTFNYGNKDRSPLDRVKFYEEDRSAKLKKAEVSTIGQPRHSDYTPVRRRTLSVLSCSSRS